MVKVLASRRLCVEPHSYFRSNVPVRLPLERKEEAQKLGGLRFLKIKQAWDIDGVLYCYSPKWPPGAC